MLEEPSVAEAEPDADNTSTSDKSETQDEVASVHNSTSGHPPAPGSDNANAKDANSGPVPEATTAGQLVKGKCLT